MVVSILCVVALVTVVAVFMNTLQKYREENNPNLRKKREYQDGEHVRISQKIVRYKGDTGRRIGDFLAYTRFNSGIVHIGFSVCDGKDKYSKKEGTKIAFDRAFDCYRTPLQIPKGIEEDFLAFYARSAAFFKKGLPTHFELYDNKSKKYVPVKIVKAVLHADGESTTVYGFEVLMSEDVAAYDEVAGVPQIPLHQISLHEDCEPDH